MLLYLNSASMVENVITVTPTTSVTAPCRTEEATVRNVWTTAPPNHVRMEPIVPTVKAVMLVAVFMGKMGL